MSGPDGVLGFIQVIKQIVGRDNEEPKKNNTDKARPGCLETKAAGSGTVLVEEAEFDIEECRRFGWLTQQSKQFGNMHRRSYWDKAESVLGYSRLNDNKELTFTEHLVCTRH